jgi:hypothetical protein
VFFFGAYGTQIRQLMLAAHDLGMLDGTYAFICVENLFSSCSGGTDGRDAEACAAFEGLININIYIPEGEVYNNFTYEVWRRMPEIGYNLSSPSAVSRFHHCFLLF